MLKRFLKNRIAEVRVASNKTEKLAQFQRKEKEFSKKTSKKSRINGV